ncbi:DarT ssDNA thymidine ADP-ribosyltransferase family protein [Gandjariella thermophila]|uniref:DarT ssDNA thymidine ADP-ribosyltransferase family protein n=1 Tax=Gandjariella thermophila TaxID=1931992 RepID=UPI0010F4B81D|nr:DarT ssDNA thymidine ADP-ribosyltransferase family protein [Gandjariella thermophila]
MGYYRESGFAALGAGKPRRDDPRNWLVWHFTHLDNLPAIAASGFLNAAANQTANVSVALNEVKARRKAIRVDPDTMPLSLGVWAGQ